MAAKKRTARRSASASKQLVLPTIPTEKRCSWCGEIKPIAEFGYRKSKKGIKRLSSWCKPCERAKSREWQKNNPEKVAAKNRQWAADNPERRKEIVRRSTARNKDSKAERNHEWYENQSEAEKRNRHLIKMFGITVEQEQFMLAAQGGVCAICGGPPTSKHKVFHVDHDHETGIIRGLLCGSCNRALGLFRDSVTILENAAAYLKASRAAAMGLKKSPPSDGADLWQWPAAMSESRC
jgi:hypothetical protein